MKQISLVFLILIASNSVFSKEITSIIPFINFNDSSKIDSESIYFYVEEMPEFPGGQIELKNYINNNLKYPESTLKDKIKGTVHTLFVIEKDGSISNVKVVRGIGAAYDKEAIRVLTSMPNFKPGKQNGKIVRIQYSVPVEFNYKNINKSK